MGRWVTSKGRRIYIPDEGEENPFSDTKPKQIVDAIKAWTAKGGEQASKYPFTSEKKKALQNYVDNNNYTTQKDIYRKISVTYDEKEKMFYNIYDNAVVDQNFDGLNSFTEDRTRAFSYGGSKQETVLFKIPKGTKVKGANIQKESIYDEQEILLGKNTFTASYNDLEWMQNGNVLVIVLKPAGEKEDNE
jgi:hypothetical protein